MQPLARSTTSWRTLPVIASAILLLSAAASAAPPTIYVTEIDDGIDPGAPVEVPAGLATTLYLYIDGGSSPSSEIHCAQGSGEEVCGFDLAIEGQNGLTISDFTPLTSVTFHLAGDALGIVGGDAWFGTLGPQKLGALTVTGTQGGTLELLASQSVNSGLAIDSISPNTLSFLPEPGLGMGLLYGASWLGWLGRTRRRPAKRRRRHHRVETMAIVAVALCASTASIPASAQVSTDCGDVVSDGVIDAADLATLKDFLAGNPGAPDLQGDPMGLARCDVSGDGLCQIDDYARIRRYMLDLTGGLNETCPLAGTTYPPVVLPPPTVDQVSPISTSEASILLTGTAEPNDVIRVDGAPGRPTATAELDGTWDVLVPLVFGQPNVLEIYRDHGGGYVSERALLTVDQTTSVGTERIAGRVLNADTSQPLAGATVDLYGVVHTADSRGLFAIEDIPSGVVALRVQETGFVPNLVWAAAGVVDGYESDSALEPIVIFMTPAAAATTVGSGGGTVTSPSGFELVVPAGSLAGNTEISLTELPTTSGTPFSAGMLLDIGPGPVTFDPPAILRLPLGTIIPAGTVVDLEQVDQLGGVTSPLVGTVSASGYAEIPISESNGDFLGYYLRHRIKAVRGYRRIRSEEYEDPGRCEFPVPTAARFGPRFIAFVPNSLAGVAAGWLTALVSRERLMAGVAHKDEFYLPIDGEVTPPGSFAVSEWTYWRKVIEEDVYLTLRNPGASPVNIPLGTLKYSVPLEGGEMIGEAEQAIFGWPAKTTPPEHLGVEFFRDCSCNSGGTSPFAPQSQSVAFASAAAAQNVCDGPAAAAWGDPHLIRFDHAGEAIAGSRGDGRYDFQGSGEFILFESTEDDMVVQVRYEPANNSTTVGTAAAMNVDGDRVSMYGGQTDLDVRIEGVTTPLTVGVPWALPGGGELERGTTSFGTDSVTVRWADGSQVLVRIWSSNHYISLFPVLSPVRFARVQGLLGNANGILIDDLNLRDGTPSNLADLYSTYADSWRISALESLFDYGPGEDTSTYNGTPTDPDFTIDDLDPVLRAAAEAYCTAAGIVDDPLLSECVIDTAVVGSDAVNAAADTLALVPNEGTYFAVPADANIFAAGQGSVPDLGGGGGNGNLPLEILLPAGTGRVLRVLDAAGTIDVSANETAIPADGLESDTIDWGEWGGLVGPRVSRKGIAMGVFLDASGPPATPPAAYACGEAGEAMVTPKIGQIFCLGDGLSQFGEPQMFFVPDAATRLYLGHADRTFVPTLDLADIVGGGDGTGNGSIQGINAIDGTVTTTHAQRLTAATNSYATSTNPLVDGVVIPDGGDGPVPISSTGIFADGISDSTGNDGASLTHAWDHIWKGHVNGVSSTLTGSVLGVATNKGITFDLDAIEAAFPGATVTATSPTAAMGNTTQASSATDYYVFVDGVPHGTASLSGAIDGANSTRSFGVIPLEDDSRFLTLITSSAGQTNNDWAFWLDTTVTLSTDGLPPGQYGDNAGVHEFVIEVR